MKTNYTQDSKLELVTKKNINNKTIIDSMFFTPPLKVIELLYIDGIAHLILLNVSPGFMKDDNQQISLKICDGSTIKITSQSYEKIHNTQDGLARRNANIIVENNASLFYAPLPCIPFKNSNFRANTDIFINDNSRLYYSEIFCAGRISLNEIFDFKKFHITTNIYKNNELIFYDNMKLQPNNMDLRSFCMFDSYTHYLQMIIYDNKIEIDYIKDAITRSQLNIAISFNGEIFIIKALANGSEELLKFQDLINF